MALAWWRWYSCDLISFIYLNSPKHLHKEKGQVQRQGSGRILIVLTSGSLSYHRVNPQISLAEGKWSIRIWFIEDASVLRMLLSLWEAREWMMQEEMSQILVYQRGCKHEWFRKTFQIQLVTWEWTCQNLSQRVHNDNSSCAYISKEGIEQNGKINYCFAEKKRSCFWVHFPVSFNLIKQLASTAGLKPSSLNYVMRLDHTETAFSAAK